MTAVLPASERQDPIQTAIQSNRDACNRLRGSLFGLVESWGVSEKQEAAIKVLIRRQTYASQAEIEGLLRGLQRKGDEGD